MSGRLGIDLDWQQLLELTAYAHHKASKTTVGLSGQHHSRRGRGLIFDQVRRYQNGDDSRSIDWRVTARTSQLHTRVMCEERQRPLHLLLDLRSNMFFGSRGCLKAYLAMQLMTILGWRGQHQQDPVSLSLLADQRVALLGGGQRRRDWLSSLAQALDYYQQQLQLASYPSSLGLNSLLEHLSFHSKSPNLAVVISDWHDLHTEHLGSLQALAHRQPLWLIALSDPFEQQLPPVDLPLSDGKRRYLITKTALSVRRQWQQQQQHRTELWQQLAQSPGIRCLSFSTQDPLAQHLVQLGQDL